MAAFCIFGCGSGGGESAETQKGADQLGDIKKRSGGDWEKLTAADKDFVIKLAHGSESTAKMLIGPPRPGPGKPAGPGGAPPAGAPGG